MEVKYVPVKDVMDAQVVTIHPGAPVEVASRKMEKFGINALPVVEDGVLVGLISQQDVTVLAIESDSNLDLETVADHMSLPAITCRENDSLEKVRELILQKRIAQVPVLDSNGHVVGVLWAGDLEVQAA